MVFTHPESVPLPKPVHSVLEASLHKGGVKKSKRRTAKERGRWRGGDGIVEGSKDRGCGWGAERRSKGRTGKQEGRRDGGREWETDAEAEKDKYRENESVGGREENEVNTEWERQRRGGGGGGREEGCCILVIAQTEAAGADRGMERIDERGRK